MHSGCDRPYYNTGTRLHARGASDWGAARGYYDRYMASQPGFAAYKVGVAFGCQIFDSLPFEDHDIKADEVVY